MRETRYVFGYPILFVILHSGYSFCKLSSERVSEWWALQLPAHCFSRSRSNEAPQLQLRVVCVMGIVKILCAELCCQWQGCIQNRIRRNCH
jgi:hypothetical protein